MVVPFVLLVGSYIYKEGIMLFEKTTPPRHVLNLYFDSDHNGSYDSGHHHASFFLLPSLVPPHGQVFVNSCNIHSGALTSKFWNYTYNFFLDFFLDFFVSGYTIQRPLPWTAFWGLLTFGLEV